MKNFIPFLFIKALVVLVLASTSVFATSNQYCAAVEEAWEDVVEAAEKAVEIAWEEASVAAVEAKKTLDSLEEAGFPNLEALVAAVKTLKKFEEDENLGLLGSVAAIKIIDGFENVDIDEKTLKVVLEAAETLDTWETLVAAVEAWDTVEEGAMKAAWVAAGDAGVAVEEYIGAVINDLEDAVEDVEAAREFVLAFEDALETWGDVVEAGEPVWEYELADEDALEALGAALEAGETWEVAVDAWESVIKAYCLLDNVQGYENSPENPLPMIAIPVDVESDSTVYLTGNDAFSCRDFAARERTYFYQLHDPDPDVDVILKYALCLLVKGEVVGNRSLIDKGLYILQELDLGPSYEDTDLIIANWIRAIYYATGGDFSIYADQNLVIAVEYFSRVLANIGTYDGERNDYPYNPRIGGWEEKFQIELDSYYQLPRLYLEISYYGVKGYYNLMILNSPSYEGDRDLKTYPDYRDNVMMYIDLAIETASVCKNLPMKKHFRSEFYTYLIEACTDFYERAKLIKSNQLKRQNLLRLDSCKDVGPDGMIRTNCPELDELDDEFESILFSGDYLIPWY